MSLGERDSIKENAIELQYGNVGSIVYGAGPIQGSKSQDISASAVQISNIIF